MMLSYPDASAHQDQEAKHIHGQHVPQALFKNRAFHMTCYTGYPCYSPFNSSKVLLFAVCFKHMNLIMTCAVDAGALCAAG